MLMFRTKTISLMLLSAALSFGIIAFGAPGLLIPRLVAAPAEQPVTFEPVWAAAAPGRVEPKGRELRVAASAPASIKEVLVGLNDRVKAGDLLIRLDDEELKAKLAAAKAEAQVRTAERDQSDAKNAALERRKAEDSLYAAERGAFEARLELDRFISLAAKNQASSADIENARAAVLAASDKLEREQANLKRVQGKNLPAPTREEAALSAARAEVAVVSTALERMHIRAPADAMVLEVHAKIGEMANPSAETALLILGDTAHLQVRAEVEERDVRKIYAGQPAIVKSDAFPGRSFDARVAVIAKALGAPQLTARAGQRKQTDVDVLEVVLDLDEGVPLLPGMRTDVLFKEAETAPKSSVAE
jgi:HlyD family secretion protein